MQQTITQADVSHPLPRARPNLATLTDEQADFYHERFSIMLYESKQEFLAVDETSLSWQVFRMAKSGMATMRIDFSAVDDAIRMEIEQEKGKFTLQKGRKK